MTAIGGNAIGLRRVPYRPQRVKLGLARCFVAVGRRAISHGGKMGKLSNHRANRERNVT
jgi:hypothetical protein